MLTYQDFLEGVKENGLPETIMKVIRDYKQSDLYKTALLADDYDHQKNTTINSYVQTIFELTGDTVEDFTASNAKIASNFFNRLNTQRMTYSLGNGVSFTKGVKTRTNSKGIEESLDTTKMQLGDKFDTDLRTAAYYALIHGVSYGFPEKDRTKVFKATEFAPLPDEEDSRTRAGIRWWQVDPKKPIYAVLYEEDGYTKFRSKKDDQSTLEVMTQKQAYKVTTETDQVTGEETVTAEENYGGVCPVIPFWGSRLHQSTLVGMRQGIDSFDLIRSGFANDLTDCSQIYWIVENCAGMSPEELFALRNRLKLSHIVNADTENGSVKPYAQEIPYQARKEYLSEIRTGIYEDFGGLDVHQVSADSTNDHLEAAYQPLDENADDFEYQIIEFVQQLLALRGLDDTPIFKRNRISNQKEQVEMVMLEAEYLDEETILNKLPNISPDEVKEIIARKDAENESRLKEMPPEDEDQPDETIKEVVV